MSTTFKGCGSCILFIITTWIVYKLSLPVFLENMDPEGNMPSDNRMEPKWRRAYGGHHVLCHHYHGDIGDQLYQYASLLALASPQDRILIAKDGDCMLEEFLVDLKVRPGASHCEGVEKIDEKFCCRDEDRFSNLELNKNYDLEGYLQTWTYFKDKEDYIKSNVKFQKPVLEKAKNVMNESFKPRNIPENKVLVGIHVKRGNFADEKHVEDGYRVAPKEYFHTAIDFFRKELKYPVFVVVSDDVDWCKENLQESADVIHLPLQKQEVAMAVFTLVKHSIISVGTFSWWAGYLTPGKVIYYKLPIEPDSKMMTEYGGTLDKTFKPTWISMS